MNPIYPETLVRAELQGPVEWRDIHFGTVEWINFENSAGGDTPILLPNHHAYPLGNKREGVGL